MFDFEFFYLSLRGTKQPHAVQSGSASLFIFDLTFEFKKGRSLRAALYAHTARALATGRVSASIANAFFSY